jgi:hypothetical protein
MLNPFSISLNPFPPSSPSANRSPPRQQQACGPAQLASGPKHRRPSSRFGPPQPPVLPRPLPLTAGARMSSPSSARPRPRLRRRRRVRARHASPCVARTPRSPRPGYLSRRRLPGRPTRAPEPPPLEPHAPETLTRAAVFGFLPPSPLGRRGAIPELRKEVRSSPVPLVVVPVGSPEFAAAPSRAAAWSAVAVAT